ncbi:hypothetical protein M513_11092 [Trichuris suis]|uniref:Uncharacterized protein n=1 Tax=Trichuris suis TaxID=68888 RepID=A0A085LSR4_9BILA|nr:hypothetical protein M513_11092 [Trichuris suis]
MDGQLLAKELNTTQLLNSDLLECSDAVVSEAEELRSLTSAVIHKEREKARESSNIYNHIETNFQYTYQGLNKPVSASATFLVES